MNTGCPNSCLEEAEALAAETPVRLDLLLSLAPVAPSSSNAVVVPEQVTYTEPIFYTRERLKKMFIKLFNFLGEFAKCCF